MVGIRRGGKGDHRSRCGDYVGNRRADGALAANPKAAIFDDPKLARNRLIDGRRRDLGDGGKHIVAGGAKNLDALPGQILVELELHPAA
jgi:hypothetical protein